MKKMLFVMNPYAGMRKANRVLPEILSVFNRSDYQVEVFMTEGTGSCKSYVEQHAQGMDIVACCGGDGTFNETVSGMIAAGLHIPIGYIPAGSTNDFAASIHLPNDPIKAAETIVGGKTAKLDIGQFGNRNFSYVASFGAFTKASYSTPQSVKNALGHAAYVLEGISEISQIRQEHVRLELDGVVVEDDFLFGAISNSTSVGGILTLDDDLVDMNDGKFEILLVRAPKDISEVGECIRALRNQTYNCAMITFCSASHVKIWADQTMDWTLDGEYEPGHDYVEVHNIHDGITIIR